MNDVWDDFVSDLKRLRPAEPNSRLTRRIEQALEVEFPNPSKTTHSLFWFRWMPLAAAASLAAMLAFSILYISRAGRLAAPASTLVQAMQTAQNQGHAARSGLQRVEADNYLVDAEDDGVVYASANTPLRKIRYQYLTASEWRNEEDHTTVKVLAPREEIVLVPINVH